MRIKNILMVSILFLSIVGYASATVNVYPVVAISDTKILPATDMSGYKSGNTLTIRASLGEITCSSFVINSDTQLNDLSISVSNLIGNNGTIPAENVDLKWVKCWYQGGYQTSWDYTRDYGRFLTGELLLNDDSLVNVIGDNWNNFSSSNPNGANYLKLENGSYINITTGASQIPQGATIQDDTIIQPLDLAPNYNKQVWVTFNVSTDIAPGTYTGTITIKSGITTISTLDIGLQVLPITLLPSTIEESVDYFGKIDNSGIISADNKSEQQYTAELLDMKRHGITNPFMVQTDNATMLRELAIRQSLGMDNSNLYLFGTVSANDIQAYKNMFALYGVENLYLYGPDEQDLTPYRSQIIDEHNSGGRHFNAEYVQKYMENNADILDLLIAARTLNSTLASQYHNSGHKIYSYLNPQTVPEYPRTFRLNYGMLLWQNDYDGAMDFAYQYGVGNIWDDFGGYRDFAFAYPTSTTPVDTIQFEGQREASNDLRYLSTLQSAIDANPYNNTAKLANAYLQSLKTKDLTNTDLDSVRTEIANYIIMIQEGDPIVNIKDGSGTGSYPNYYNVSISANEQNGLSFDKWVGDTQYVDNIYDADTTLRLQTANVNLTATYTCLWYDTNFSHRKIIEINNSSVSNTTQNNFVMLLNIIDPTLKTINNNGSVVYSNGSDIIYVLPNNTVLSDEKELYNETSGNLVDWVNVTLSSTNSTFIIMYYGNHHSPKINKTATWDSNYLGVYHLNETGRGLTGDFKDSTANSYNSINTFNQPTRIDGLIGGAQSFDGVNTYIDIGNAIAATDAITVDVIVNPTTTDDKKILGRGWNAWSLFSNYKTICMYNVINGSYDMFDSNFVYSAGIPYKITYTYDNKTERFFINGIEVNEKQINGLLVSTNHLYFGAIPGISNNFSGSLDEIKISNIARSAGNLKTEYNNQFSPSTFYSIYDYDLNPNVNFRS